MFFETKKNASILALFIGLFGITTDSMASPHHRMTGSEYSLDSANCVYPDGTSPKGQPKIHCYEPKQFLAAYGIDQLHARGITGKGQTIILVDSFGSPTMQQDLDHFSDTFGLPRTTIKFIYPNGEYVNDMSTEEKAGWAGETTLDLEWAHAIAPDATLVNLITTSAESVGLAGFPDIFKGIQMAIAQYPGSIISMSFGTGEPTFTASDLTLLQGSYHQIFQQASEAGITLLASAGDSGSTNLNSDQTGMITYANASYPATDPFVTAVGGTALEAGWRWTPEGTADNFWDCTLSKNKSCPVDFLKSIISANFLGESVWKEDWAIAAGGGGVSTIFGAPGYQTNLPGSVQGVLNGHRGIPDVSFNAAINGGVDVFSSYQDPSAGVAGSPSWQSTGGTSCAAPETAALIALAGQLASDTLGKPTGIGYLNPIIYSLSGDDFNDVLSQTIGVSRQVTIGDDSLYFSQQLSSVYTKNVPSIAVPGYATTVGYDLATGRGSPKAPLFVMDVAKARVALESKR